MGYIPLQYRKDTLVSFEIEIYEKDNGDNPFEEFMESLSLKLKAKTLRDIDLLEQFGNELREPYTKHLQDEIFELRTIVGTDISRLLFFFYYKKKIVITHGFVKRKRKTPKKEIKKAISYREDWLRRKENEI